MSPSNSSLATFFPLISLLPLLPYRQSPGSETFSNFRELFVVESNCTFISLSQGKKKKKKKKMRGRWKFVLHFVVLANFHLIFCIICIVGNIRVFSGFLCSKIITHITYSFSASTFSVCICGLVWHNKSESCKVSMQAQHKSDAFRFHTLFTHRPNNGLEGWECGCMIVRGVGGGCGVVGVLR